MKASFFDLDGTLTSSQWWRGYIGYFKEMGQKRLTHLAFLSLHYPLYILSKVGLVSTTQFRRPWARHLPWYLRGCEEDEVEVIWRWVIDRYLSNYWRDDCLQLMKEKRAQGDLIVLVSACMSPLLRTIGTQLGVEHCVGTELQLMNHQYTGRVAGEVCIADQKAAMSQEYIRDQGLAVNFESSEAFADSTSDMSLLEMVGHPVAVHPDSQLRKLAVERGWRIYDG